jgi:hypothetical protein
LIPEGGGVGASYFHDAVDGDFLAEIKPRIPEWVISGVKITLSDLHQTLDLIGRSPCIHFLLENPELRRRLEGGRRRAILKALLGID